MDESIDCLFYKSIDCLLVFLKDRLFLTRLQKLGSISVFRSRSKAYSISLQSTAATRGASFFYDTKLNKKNLQDFLFPFDSLLLALAFQRTYNVFEHHGRCANIELIRQLCSVPSRRIRLYALGQ
jgi:hypothetical protein